MKPSSKSVTHVAALAAVIATLLPSRFVFAQVVNDAPASLERKDEVVVLSPFEVSTRGVIGYGTTSSLSASRLAVPITDIPASVITINENLIADTVAVDMRDTFNLVSGINHGNQGTGLQEQAQISLRGYNTSGAFRDGLPDLNYTNDGGFDYGMIERIEIIKGPAGVLYGQHNAGGVVNLISKRPLIKPMTKIGLTVGSYNLWRAELDHSGFVDSKHKLGYRLAAVTLDTDGAVDAGGEPDKLSHWINPSLSYQFDSGLKVWAWSAFVDDNSKRVAYSAWAFGTADGRGRVYYPLIEEGKTSVVYQNFMNSRNTNYELGLSHSFSLGPVEADLRLVGRLGDRYNQFDRTRSDGTQRFIDADGKAIPGITGLSTNSYDAIDGRVVRFGRAGIRYNVGGTNFDATDIVGDLNLKFTLGPTTHHFLVTAQFSDYDRRVREADYRVANVANLPADVREKFRFNTAVAGVGLAEIWPNPPAGVGDLRGVIQQYATTTEAPETQVLERELRNYGLVDSISMLDNRLIFVAGYRHDEDRSFTDIPDRPTFTATTEEVSEETGKLGAVVKAYKGARGEISLFYNKGDTFVPESTIDLRLETFGQKMPNRMISTNEIGLKVDLLGGRIVGTASYFDNEENNVLLQEIDEDGSITGSPGKVYRYPGGVATTKGYELDFAFTPKPGLNMMASYSQIDSLLTTGKPNSGVPEHTFASTIRYEFQSGPLKGLSLGWIYNAWGASWTSSSSNFVMPFGDLHTAVIGYNWRNYTVRLRIENIDDDFDTQPSTFYSGIGMTKPLNFRFNITARF